VKPNANGEAQEVKIKVRINHNGVILISSAQMVEKKEVVDAEQNGGAVETDVQANAQQPPQAGSPQSPKDGPEPMDVQQQEVSFSRFSFNLVYDLLN
jgi:heat shock protein